ncbi:MAG: four helix bundle protein [Bacteroidota bacterium]
MTYKDLEIWQLARGLVVDINRMTLNDLPRHELYETGSQIRRSSVSVKANIVEGYCRRKYKLDFIRFLFFSLSSNDETIDHLETLFEIGALRNKEKYEDIHRRLELLGKKLTLFIRAVGKSHNAWITG